LSDLLREGSDHVHDFVLSLSWHIRTWDVNRKCRGNEVIEGKTKVKRWMMIKKEGKEENKEDRTGQER
jgi:hypothetical protein